MSSSKSDNQTLGSKSSDDDVVMITEDVVINERIQKPKHQSKADCINHYLRQSNETHKVHEFMHQGFSREEMH